MSRASVRNWFRSTLAFVAVTVLGYVPAVLLLALTPIHDGDELPSPRLLISAAALCVFVGGAVGRSLHRRGREPDERALSGGS